MAFLSADQRELFQPLLEGVHETPPFANFMRNLVARTYARRAFLLILPANAAPDQTPTVIHIAAPRAVQEPPIDLQRLESLGLHPYNALRAGRVYSLEELLDHDSRERQAVQRAVLDEMRIGYARVVRVTVGGAADAWVLLVREREDFSAAATALLSTLAPHLASALRTLVVLMDQRTRLALSESALARLGIGQMVFDGTGRVMAADPVAEAVLSFLPEPGTAPGRRLQLLPDVARMLDQACSDLAAGRAEQRILCIDAHVRRNLLLRRSDLELSEPAALPAVIGTLRVDRREDAAAAARVIAHQFGLSDREAALAHALSLGESLVEAGRSLHLTDETTRNYSKRIYAKTGARGQADLVRLLLTSLMTLC
jgi:DNA-binding CsgD family transcriptional regulator